LRTRSPAGRIMSQSKDSSIIKVSPIDSKYLLIVFPIQWHSLEQEVKDKQAEKEFIHDWLDLNISK